MSLRGNLSYGTYRLVGAVMGPMPPRIGYWVARGAGRLLYNFDSKLTRTLTHNLRHVLGPDASEKDVQERVRQACVNIAKGHYELLRVNRLSDDDIRTLTRIEGREHVDRAMEAGRGVILVSAHLGNVDVAGQLPLVYGLPLTSVVWRTEPERLFNYAKSLRESHGLRLIPSDGSMLELFRVLRRGEAIILVVDRTVGTSVRDVEFFGSPAPLTDGAVRIARRTGTPLIPAFAIRLPDDSFEVRIEPALELPDTGDQEADVADGMRQFVSIMEKHIFRHPEQWLVAAPVWPMEPE